jgi:hypothetical protein
MGKDDASAGRRAVNGWKNAGLPRGCKLDRAKVCTGDLQARRQTPRGRFRFPTRGTRPSGFPFRDRGPKDAGNMRPLAAPLPDIVVRSHRQNGLIHQGMP